VRRVSAALLIALVLLAGGGARATTIEATTLPTPAKDAAAFGINDAGEIVGHSQDQSGNQAALLWNAATPDAAPVVLAGFGTTYLATGINAAGEIVGSGSARGQAKVLVWNASDPTAAPSVLGSPPTLANQLSSSLGAADVNSPGLIVGSALTFVSVKQPFPNPPRTVLVARALLWTSDAAGAAPIVLPGIGGKDAQVSAINAQGLIVGSDRDSGGVVRALVWNASDPTAAPLVLPDFGSGAEALGINDAGLIVGTDFTSALLWNASDPTAAPVVLGPVPDFGASGQFFATGINDSGRVVGYGTGAGGFEAALLWSADDPAAEPAILSDADPNGRPIAWSVNGQGEVVGNGNDPAAGTYHALLWETAAPEPAAGACVLLGLGALVLSRGRRPTS
jgi:probable HAF family extracellular repeat protein